MEFLANPSLFLPKTKTQVDIRCDFTVTWKIYKSSFEKTNKMEIVSFSEMMAGILKLHGYLIFTGDFLVLSEWFQYFWA